MKTRVVDIEPTLESGGKPVFGVEDDTADKGSRVVALGVENFGQKRNAWREAIAEVANAVVLRIRSGEYGRVRDWGNGCLGVCTLEYYALTRQRILVRRQTSL